jgi:putative ABC transport system substrate-binding protein
MRWLICLAFGFALLAGPVSAQTGGERVFRLAQLAPSKVSAEYTRAVTLPELAKLGFVEGKNLVVLDRYGEEAVMPRLMRELLGEKPDAIVAIGGDAVKSAATATKTVPIVGFGPDVIFLGLAASLSRPRGNVTGVLILAAELDAKRIEILSQALPSARRFSALLMPTSVQRATSERAMRKFAAEAGLTLQILDAAQPAEYPRAFEKMKSAGAEAVVITANTIFYRDGPGLAALALQARLPTVCEWADMVEIGCLIGYGPNRAELRRRIAHLVARVFQGAAPGDLPIEAPALFELAVNQKIARALGVVIPADLLARADMVVE